MGFFLGDPEARQKLQNGAGFDFQLASQLVNTNLRYVRHSARLGLILW